MPLWQYVTLGILLLAAELLYFRLAARFGIIDTPNRRSSHRRPTIRGGGIVFPLAMLGWGLLSGFTHPYLVAGVLLVAVVSFIDDVRGLGFRIRLPLHFLSTALILLEAGYFGLPWYAWLPAFILLSGFLNAYNFMDGINGITGLYSLLIALFLLAAAAMLPRPGWYSPLILLTIALLIFNFFNFRNKARCFAGDVGAISLALWLGYYMLALLREFPSPIWLLPVAVYAVDSVMTILYRLLKGENIFRAHRHHLYQNLSNEWGWPHLQASSLYGFLQLLVNAAALLLWRAEVFAWPYVILIYLVLVALYVGGKWQVASRFPVKSY